MVVVNRHSQVTEDNWTFVEVNNLPTDVPLPQICLSELLHLNERPDVLVPMTDALSQSGLVAETMSLINNHSSRIGVWCATDTSTETLDELLAASKNADSVLLGLDLVLIHVPAFADGRGFSLAMHLRQQGYEGEIRMSGDFGRDQLAYLTRSGVDTFVVAEQELKGDFMSSFDALESAQQGRAASNLPMFR